MGGEGWFLGTYTLLHFLSRRGLLGCRRSGGGGAVGAVSEEAGATGAGGVFHGSILPKKH